MATPLEEKKARRALFMRRLYDETDGYALARAVGRELVKDLELTEEQFRELEGYLIAEELVRSSDWGGGISITHRGVVEVEQSLQRPERPTEHFPPSTTVLQIFGPVTGSNIAQGSPHATQTLTYTAEEREALSMALQRAKALLGQGLLADEDEQVLRADLQTAEVQLASPRPSRATITMTIASMVNVLSVLSGDNQLVQAAIEGFRPFLKK